MRVVPSLWHGSTFVIGDDSFISIYHPFKRWKSVCHYLNSYAAFVARDYVFMLRVLSANYYHYYLSYFPVKYSFACLFLYLFSYISLRCVLRFRIHLKPIYISLSKIACLCFLAFAEKKCQKAVYISFQYAIMEEHIGRRKKTKIYHHR